MKQSPKYLLPLTTVMLLLLATLIFQRSPDIQTASQIGGYISAIAASLAFVWLIAGFFQQSKELKLQREELSMQREALMLQKEELKKISKFNALQQISTMLDSFNSSLPSKKIPNISNVEDLSMAFMGAMQSSWKIILESTNYQEVFDAHNKWLPVESICRQFISTVYSAVKLYAETTGEITLLNNDDEAQFVYFDHEKIRSIPHLQQYFGAAYAVASNLFLFEPGLKRIRLAGFEASDKVLPGVVKQEALEKLRKEVELLDEKKVEKPQNP